jgi:esterase/lipase superfamily enzyme
MAASNNLDYVICVRREKAKEDKFDPQSSGPGTALYLEVPGNKGDIFPSQHIDKDAWTKKVIEKANGGPVKAGTQAKGDIVFFVHGFNTATSLMMERHRKIRKHLEADGFQGTVISFDWPCNTAALNYAEDRWDAKKSAIKLVKHGILRFAKYQEPGCEVNMHILAHSMGTFVVREAFDDADDVAGIASISWSVSQVMLMSGDVSSASLGDNRSKSSSLYRHTVRLTNYFNPYDDILKLSNVKRVGVSPRVGRIGLPTEVPRKAVNVNCGEHYNGNRAAYKNTNRAGHNWYFDEPKFFVDVHETIKGDVDRELIKTRKKDAAGGLHFTGRPVRA